MFIEAQTVFESQILLSEVRGLYFSEVHQGTAHVSGFCAVVGQGENIATVENQPVDDPQTGKFTWTIENFSKINLRKHYSDSFTVGGYKW